MQKGISLNWVLSPDGSQVTLTPDDIARLSEAGATVARVDIRLGTRPSWDSTIIANYKTVIADLTEQGIAVLGLLGPGIVPNSTQDQWNQDNAENGGSGMNSWIGQYTATVSMLVQAFTDIHLWELWNEPNEWVQHSGTVYSGGSYIYPSLFAALLNQSQPAIKAIRPTDTVITGGLLAQDNTNTNTDSAGSSYLDALYVAGGWDTHHTPFDAIGLHLYIDQLGALNPQNFQRYIDYYLSADVAHEGEFRWKQVYVTEFGWTTKQVSEQQQAINLAALLSLLSDQPYIHAALNFQIRDNPAGNQYYGLYHADGTPKESLTAYKNAA